MKISEPIALLQQRLSTHGDREAETAWEGITREIRPCNVCLANEANSGMLFIDADRNSNKPAQAADKWEGELCDRCHGKHHEPGEELAEHDGTRGGNGMYCHYCLSEFRMEE